MLGSFQLVAYSSDSMYFTIRCWHTLVNENVVTLVFATYFFIRPCVRFNSWTSEILEQILLVL